MRIMEDEWLEDYCRTFESVTHYTLAYDKYDC